MKKCLVVSYMFPPVAGIGIQRALKFVKYLPSFGITPVVFSPRNVTWKASENNSNQYRFLEKTKIHRHGVKKLKKYFRVRFEKNNNKHIYLYYLALKYAWFIDFQSAWYFESRKTLLEIAKSEKVDCVLTTSPPHSVHLFGNYLHNKLDLPWIMDLRDAMYDNADQEKDMRSRFLCIIQYLYEKKFYKNCNKIITVSKPIQNSMKLRHPSLNIDRKSFVITNGFDEDDFKHNLREKENNSEKLIITYAGSFMGRRTPKYFLKALKLLVSKGQIDKADLKIQFVGFFDEYTIEIFKYYKKYLPIEILDFQPYRQSLKIQMNSDLLLLIISVDETEGGDQILTGKLFEYIGALRPIFALAPKGPLKDIIEKGKFGTVAPTKNIINIADKFKIVYDEWKKMGSIGYDPNLDLRDKYTRKNITKELASIINKL